MRFHAHFLTWVSACLNSGFRLRWALIQTRIGRIEWLPLAHSLRHALKQPCTGKTLWGDPSRVKLIFRLNVDPVTDHPRHLTVLVHPNVASRGARLGAREDSPGVCFLRNSTRRTNQTKQGIVVLVQHASRGACVTSRHRKQPMLSPEVAHSDSLANGTCRMARSARSMPSRTQTGI
jgi:hypothetical protein